MLPLSAGREASPVVGAPVYERHRPERMLLYQLSWTPTTPRSRALLVDEVLPHEPMRQLTPGMACSRAMQEQLPRVLSVPFPLRFVFASRKVFRLQTLPACDEADAGKVAGFSLPQGTLSPRPGSHLVHAGVAAKADERKKLERLFRYIARPAVSEKRLSLTSQGQVRYDVKGFTSVAGAWMRKSD